MSRYSITLVALMAVATVQSARADVAQVPPVLSEIRGETVFADFGVDSYGVLEVDFRTVPPVGSLKVRLGEKLDGNGAIDRQPGGSINYQEVLLNTVADKLQYKIQIPTRWRPGGVTSPADVGEITPFRYIEIEGAKEAVGQMIVKQLFVHAPFADQASEFTSSDNTLNGVWELCKHTIKATTAFGLYIDGDRERKPYEGDSYINLLSHYACDLDPKVARNTFDYLLQNPTWPTEWSLIMPMIAYEDYLATGDPAMASKHYEALKEKLMMRLARPDGLLVHPGLVDWPAVERDGYGGGISGQHDRREVGPEVNTVVNAYYCKSLSCMARLAAALNKADDARDLDAQASRVSEAFNKVFFDAARGLYRDGEGSSHISLHANMFPLAFGLVPRDRLDSVTSYVESRGMACSVFGAEFLLEGLYSSGHSQAALNLMRSDGPHSWAHMTQMGASMTTEAWDPSIKPNLTWNHAWGTAPANIITRFLLGVRPLKPGYDEMEIAPQPADLQWMRGKVPTAHGPATVAWQSNPPTLQIEIPSGARATILLPKPLGAGGTVTVNGKALNVPAENGGYVLRWLPGGKYLVR